MVDYDTAKSQGQLNIPASAPVTPRDGKGKVPGLKRAATTNALFDNKSNGSSINSKPIAVNKDISNYAKLPGFGMY